MPSHESSANTMETARKKTPFYLLERRLIVISLLVAAAQILLFWGHRLPLLNNVAALLATIQDASAALGDQFFLRGYFLFPCIMAGWLTVRMVLNYRRLNWLNAGLLAINLALAAHSVICLIVLLRV